MPYIKKENKQTWEKGINQLIASMEVSGVTPGDLNYIITKLVHGYVATKGKNYTHLNDVKGVFAAASDEFTRRVVNPYEDQKIQENGDL